MNVELNIKEMLELGKKAQAAGRGGTEGDTISIGSRYTTECNSLLFSTVHQFQTYFVVQKYSLFLGIKKKMECKMKELKHVVIIGVFIYFIYSLPLVPCPSYSVSIIFYRSSNHHPMLHSSCKSSTCLQTVLCKNCMIDNQLTH